MKEKNTDLQSTFKSIVLPIQQYIRELELSGIILLSVTIIALILANSSFGESFLHFWHTLIQLQVGGMKVSLDLHMLINDVFMTLFFIVVGGEIKSEIIEGALSTKEKAILPVVAALGGMLFPALIYTAFNFAEPTSSGWGIPTATDIAFSLTVISLLGKKAPFSLKIFLAALAIADDLGAIVVIALFYSDSLDVYYLLGGIGVTGILFCLNYWGINRLRWSVLFGIILWYFFYMAGIHPTIAGVVFAIAVPFRLDNWEEVFAVRLREVQGYVEALSDKSLKNKMIRGEYIEKMQQTSTRMEAPLHNVLVFLHPVSNYFIMPLFAFANAGVIINTEAISNIFSPVSLGIISGLMLGKSTGIWFTSWVAVKLKLAQIPDDVSWMHMYGMAWVAGIGFTMSMFVTGLAFKDAGYIETAKMAILVASTLSGLAGYFILYMLGRKKA